LNYTLGGGEISHAVVSWDGNCCMDDFTSTASGSDVKKVVTVDPTTCAKGLKYDQAGGAGNTFSYTIYDDNLDLVPGYAIIKQKKFFCQIQTLVPKCS